MRKKHLFNKYLTRRLAAKQPKLPNGVGLLCTWTNQNIYTVGNNLLNLTYWGCSQSKLNGAKYLKKVNNVERTFIGATVLKFKYVGKSYRVKYKENVIFLKFNRAHRTTLLSTNLSIKPFKRLWFKIRTWYAGTKLVGVGRCINSARRRNIYTKRGLWSQKAFLYKKRGKISAYR